MLWRTIYFIYSMAPLAQITVLWPIHALAAAAINDPLQGATRLVNKALESNILRLNLKSCPPGISNGLNLVLGSNQTMQTKSNSKFHHTRLHILKHLLNSNAHNIQPGTRWRTVVNELQWILLIEHELSEEEKTLQITADRTWILRPLNHCKSFQQT